MLTGTGTAPVLTGTGTAPVLTGTGTVLTGTRVDRHRLTTVQTAHPYDWHRHHTRVTGTDTTPV